MPTKIPENFKPSEQSYANLRKHGVLVDFVEDQLPGFITYWQDTGKKKASWQMTLQTWMRRAHQGRAGREWEESRHIRNRYSGGLKNDLFDACLKKIENPTTCKPVSTSQRKYRLPAPPPPGPAMTRDEALAELAKLRKTL